MASKIKISEEVADKIIYLSSMRVNIPTYQNRVTMIPVDDNIIILKEGWKSLVFFSLELSTAGKSHTILVSCRISDIQHIDFIHYVGESDGSSYLPSTLISTFEMEILNRLIYLSDHCRSLTEFYIIDDDNNFHIEIRRFQSHCEASRSKMISFVPLTPQN